MVVGINFIEVDIFLHKKKIDNIVHKIRFKTAMLNIDNLKKMVEEKYISVQKHPEFDLWIYNYTQRTHFDKVWNEETMQCRGLILDKDYNIVARPFRKFWNWEQHTEKDSKLPPLPLESFEVTEKMDGSLGILYVVNNKPHIATRGSFVSEQALKGTDLLRKRLTVEPSFKFEKGFTWLWEIIYPENRVVINYGDKEDLFLLSIIDNETGKSIDPSLFSQDLFPNVKRYDGINDIAKLREKAEDNKEGFVIYFPLSDVRTKLKFEEYIRLHRLITGVNKKTIWELLKHHQPFDELIERVPDEFLQWIKDTKKNLKHEYEVIEVIAQNIYEQAEKLPTRKEQAIMVMNKENKEYSAIVFKMLDKKPYEEVIWKMVRPVAEKPFKEQNEAVA